MRPESSPNLPPGVTDDEFYVALQFDNKRFGCGDFDDPSDFVHENTGSVVLADYSGDPLKTIGKFNVIQVDAEGAVAQGVGMFAPSTHGLRLSSITSRCTTGITSRSEC